MGSGIAGRSVLITRSAEDAGEWATQLRRLGARAIIFPCLECVSSDDIETRTALREALSHADWLVVTSRHGARAAWELLKGVLPARVRVAVVGAQTAEAVASHFACTPEIVARVASAKGLGAELAQLLPNGDARRAPTIVIAAAADGRKDVENALSGTAVSVTRIEVYRTIPAAPVAVKRDLAADEIDAIWLASPSAVHGLLNRAVVPSQVPVVTIGPTTSAAARAAGLTVTAEARHQDFTGMLKATR